MLGGGAPESRHLVGAAFKGWEVSAGLGGHIVAPSFRMGGWPCRPPQIVYCQETKRNNNNNGNCNNIASCFNSVSIPYHLHFYMYSRILLAHVAYQ